MSWPSSVIIIVVGVIVALTYQSVLKPPPAKLCGFPGGSPITAPRIKLRDGRYLAYKEHGLPREKARRKIIFIHGSDSCRLDAVYATLLSPVILLANFVSTVYISLLMINFKFIGFGGGTRRVYGFIR